MNKLLITVNNLKITLLVIHVAYSIFVIIVAGDYDSNKCRSAHCIPCHIRYPSCDGFGDGMNPWKGREGSPNYVICQEGRVVYQGECPRYADTQHIFHPVKKLCVDFKEMDM